MKPVALIEAAVIARNFQPQPSQTAGNEIRTVRTERQSRPFRCPVSFQSCHVAAFATQRDKRWFNDATFDGLMRLRGVESASPTGYAEGFHGHKITIL